MRHLAIALITSKGAIVNIYNLDGRVFASQAYLASNRLERV